VAQQVRLSWRIKKDPSINTVVLIAYPDVGESVARLVALPVGKMPDEVDNEYVLKMVDGCKGFSVIKELIKDKEVVF